MEQVNLSMENYEQFLRCLSILKDVCNDADIQGGILRQRTNDSANVFEINMTPIIDTMNIPLVNLKQKLDLLKIFQNQNSTQSQTVDITVDDDNNFTFSDEYSSIKFQGPDLDYMDNRYINVEELETIFTLNEEDVILQTDIESNISDRMRIIAQSFNVNSTQITFENEVASITMATQSHDQNAKILSEITLEQPMECVSSLINTPFIIDHDGKIELKMYNYQEQICSNTFKTAISDIDIAIYGRSSLMEE
jgi:hypothetical protein